VPLWLRGDELFRPEYSYEKLYHDVRLMLAGSKNLEQTG